MLIYILVVAFPLLIDIWYRKRVAAGVLSVDGTQNRKLRWKFIFLAALPMFVLIAFRNQSIGADTGVYIYHFNKMITTPWPNIFENSNMDPGYVIFVKLITVFTDDPLVYQVICALIYLLAITTFTNQQEDNHFLILFLYGSLGMYTFMFTGVRQCLAISVCLFSYRFIKERKLIPFILLMIIAFYFHNSAILFAAAYLIYPRKLSFPNALMYAIGVILSVIYLDVIQKWFNERFEYDYGIESGAGGEIFAVLIICITAFTIYAMVKGNVASREAKGSTNIGMITAFFWLLRLFTRVAERPSYYFMLCTFASFAYAISTLKDYKEKYVVKMLVISFAMLLFIYRLLNNQANFIPYSIFTK